LLNKDVKEKQQFDQEEIQWAPEKIIESLGHKKIVKIKEEVRKGCSGRCQLTIRHDGLVVNIKQNANRVLGT
jgi:hypothetical protein